MTKESIDVEVRVRYAETDKMGVAYYANYFVWFEVGRAELCRIKGFSYADLEALGYILVVTDAHCHYRNPARYDEAIIIRTRLKEMNKRMITFGYQLLKKRARRSWPRERRAISPSVQRVSLRAFPKNLLKFSPCKVAIREDENFLRYRHIIPLFYSWLLAMTQGPLQGVQPNTPGNLSFFLESE